MVVDVKLVEYHEIDGELTPLIYEAGDKDRAVSLKSGKKAAKLAAAIHESLERIGHDYEMDDSILYDSYKIRFSLNPLPMYKGLDKEKIDVIRIPKYMAFKRVAKHEGSHMAHRRLLEQRLDEKGEVNTKVESENVMKTMWKSSSGLCERFANVYSGLSKQSFAVGASGKVLSYTGIILSSAKLMSVADSIALHQQEAAAAVASISLLAYGAYVCSKILGGYFSPLEEITEV